MKKITIEWRKATEEELKNGSDEMIKVREIEVDAPDEAVHDDTTLKTVKLTDYQLNKLLELLK